MESGREPIEQKMYNDNILTKMFFISKHLQLIYTTICTKKVTQSGTFFLCYDNTDNKINKRISLQQV